MANTGFGSYQTGEVVYQGYSAQTASASGKVIFWSNNVLHLKQISGHFVSTQPIIGMASNSNYVFNSYQVQPQTLAQIVVTPTPTDANSSTLHTYTTTITETPDINPIVTTSSNFSGDMLTQFGLDNLEKEQENPIDLGS
jgi:hypothetical protein